MCIHKEINTYIHTYIHTYVHSQGNTYIYIHTHTTERNEQQSATWPKMCVIKTFPPVTLCMGEIKHKQTIFELKMGILFV